VGFKETPVALRSRALQGAAAAECHANEHPLIKLVRVLRCDHDGGLSSAQTSATPIQHRHAGSQDSTTKFRKGAVAGA
jgi:hypothetical protein